MTTDDTVALRSLVDAYALAADHADGAAAARLFVEDGRMTLWTDPAGAEPTGVRRGRDEIAAALDSLSRFRATHHAISSVGVAVVGDRATGEVMCVAHHLDETGPEALDRVLYIRYADVFVRAGVSWLFESRELRVQWVDVRPVVAG